MKRAPRFFSGQDQLQIESLCFLSDLQSLAVNPSPQKQIQPLELLRFGFRGARQQVRPLRQHRTHAELPNPGVSFREVEQGLSDASPQPLPRGIHPLFELTADPFEVEALEKPSPVQVGRHVERSLL